MDTQQIKQAISDIRFYNVESLRAMASVANEIRQVKDAETRRELTRMFEAQHGRKVAVWSRIVQRFSDVLAEIKTVDGFLALSYMCQLPEGKSLELFAAHADHLDEPMVHQLVLRDVNDSKSRRAKTAPKVCPHCERTEKAFAELQETSDAMWKHLTEIADELGCGEDGAKILPAIRELKASQGKAK